MCLSETWKSKKRVKIGNNVKFMHKSANKMEKISVKSPKYDNMRYYYLFQQQKNLPHLGISNLT